MKSATIPSLRVDPELRKAAESILREGETLSAFMEEALRSEIRHRKTREEFIAKGLAARDEARMTGEYFSADSVLTEMNVMLDQGKEQ